MARFFLVCLGGAAGTGARYLLGGWAQRTLGATFPWGTLIINALGSFVIVILMHLSVERGVISPDLRVVLTTGVMGGFTTYSTFNYETIRLFQDGALGLGALNVAATVLVCLLAGGVAVLICRAIG
jgi:fluoride exporter